MAGDRNCQRVGRARLGHCSHCFRRADAAGNLAIARGRAGWDLLQRLPDSPLERGALDIERQVEAEPGSFHESDHLRHQLLELGIAADQRRSREPVLEGASQGVGIIAQENGTDSELAPGHENGPEGALADGKADIGVGTPAR